MKKSYHFIGIGGIGMGALAFLLMEKGHRVSGSDLKQNAMTSRLKDAGADISACHAAENINDADVVVYSSAISEDHLERKAAERKQILQIRRATLLAELVKLHKGLIVCGTHGKTTTAAMLTWILQRAGLDPSHYIGAEVPLVGECARAGEGDYFVAEGDESDGSLIEFFPYCA
ncbi:MAG: UDP-N-acetylmuramate--L-alanine ligase, partial [Candidatus Omnitrophica bacterium]|nr:UDP-N-acetylmuramate--L-alanine ligase [Candidatus Omnitrophota bacterium]